MNLASRIEGLGHTLTEMMWKIIKVVMMPVMNNISLALTTRD
jgi:hypothetical protein